MAITDSPTSVTRTSVNESAKDSTMTNTEAGSLPDNVHMSSHPVLSHKLTLLRSSATPPQRFRSVLREITFYLGYEATQRALSTKPVSMTVSVRENEHVDYTGDQLAEKIAIVPILRSGLGMVEPMLELLPNAGVHHIGMYKKGLMPVQYYNRLPKKCNVDVVFVLDPCIATACTAISVVGIMKKVGARLKLSSFLFLYGLNFEIEKLSFCCLFLHVLCFVHSLVGCQKNSCDYSCCSKTGY